jgi:non-homologous end joining protein Ku
VRVFPATDSRGDDQLQPAFMPKCQTQNTAEALVVPIVSARSDLGNRQRPNEFEKGPAYVVMSEDDVRQGASRVDRASIDLSAVRGRGQASIRIYFERPYYLAPGTAAMATEAGGGGFAVIAAKG